MTSATFVQELRNNFAFNEPIFTEELLKMLPDYSRAQIFRYVDIAKKDNVLVQYDIGIYFMPTITFFGEQSVMSVDKVIEKKYLMNNKQIYGVFSGIKLLNMFGVTTQMAGIVEIVTNKESSKKRTILKAYKKHNFLLLFDILTFLK